MLVRLTEPVPPEAHLGAGFRPQTEVRHRELATQRDVEYVESAFASTRAASVRGPKKNDDGRVQQHRQQHEARDGRWWRLGTPPLLPYGIS